MMALPVCEGGPSSFIHLTDVAVDRREALAGIEPAT